MTVIEGVSPDWVVARETDTGEAQFYTGDLDRLRETLSAS